MCRWRCLLASLLAAFLTAAASAGPVIRINLGTLAPRGSSYHQALLAMAETWRKESGGTVRLVVYPDGTQGTEADMVRLMRIGSLQAGLLTSTGLETIESSVAGLQKLPFVFHHFAEFDHVMADMSPQLAHKLEARGFHVLFWIDAGWLRLFSTGPARTPDDFARTKFFVWADPKQAEILRRIGQNPVNLETNDLPAALQTGLITAMPAPPIYVLAMQLDRRAKYMLRINYAPLIGAAVVTEAAWQRIPGDLRMQLSAAAAKTGEAMRARGRAESDEAVTAMQKRGLIVEEPTPRDLAAWQTLAERAYPMIRGGLMPADLFDGVQRELAAYRAQHPGP